MTALREVWFRVVESTDANGNPCRPRVEQREFVAEENNGGWRSVGMAGPGGFRSSVYYATYEPDARGWGAKANGWRKTPREAIEAALAKACDRAGATKRALEAAEAYEVEVAGLLVSLVAGEAT